MKYLRKVASAAEVVDPKLDKPVVFMEDNENKDLTIYPEGRTIKFIYTNSVSGIDTVKYHYISRWASTSINTGIFPTNDDVAIQAYVNQSDECELPTAKKDESGELIINWQLSDAEMNAENDVYAILHYNKE